jgi:hypothetical protein
MGRKIRKHESYFDMRKRAGLPLQITDLDKPKVPTYGAGWRFKWDQEYPWRIECTIPGDENWRGTWTLEVKNMSEVNWISQKVHDGKGWKDVALPAAPHWHNPPFLDNIGI